MNNSYISTILDNMTQKGSVLTQCQKNTCFAAYLS